MFELEDKHSHLVGSLGKIIHMGPSAVVRHRGLTILLTSKKLPPFDLGQWRSQGINPEELSMIGIKAAVGHRVAYGKIAAAEFTVNTRALAIGSAVAHSGLDPDHVEVLGIDPLAAPLTQIHGRQTHAGQQDGQAAMPHHGAGSHADDLASEPTRWDFLSSSSNTPSLRETSSTSKVTGPRSAGCLCRRWAK